MMGFAEAARSGTGVLDLILLKCDGSDSAKMMMDSMLNDDDFDAKC